MFTPVTLCPCKTCLSLKNAISCERQKRKMEHLNPLKKRMAMQIVCFYDGMFRYHITKTCDSHKPLAEVSSANAHSAHSQLKAVANAKAWWNHNRMVVVYIHSLSAILVSSLSWLRRGGTFVVLTAYSHASAACSFSMGSCQSASVCLVQAVAVWPWMSAHICRMAGSVYQDDPKEQGYTVGVLKEQWKCQRVYPPNEKCMFPFT